MPEREKKWFPSKLKHLSDVVVQNPGADQFIAWDTGSHRWTNLELNLDGTYAKLDHHHDTDYAALSHDHDERYYTQTEVDALIDELDPIPTGLISMWSGQIVDIPDGWFLCDGENGTPDLRNRFMVGAGDEYNPFNMGGQKEVTLTESEMPEHSHPYTRGARLPEPTDTSNNFEDYASGVQMITSDTSTTGSNQPHENRPPYYALAFIMKA